MKILVVCQHYKPEPFRIHDLCEELVQRGHYVCVLTGVPNYPEGVIYDEYKHHKNRHENINGADVHRSLTIGRGKSKLKRFLNYYSFAISSSLKVLFNRCKPANGGDFDVVLVEQLSPVMMAYAGMLYKKLHNKKLVMYCFDLWPESLLAGGVRKNSFVYNFYHRVSKKIYSYCDHILVTSRMFIEYMNREFGIEKSRISYLPQYTDSIFEQDYNSDDNKSTVDLVFAGYIGQAQSVQTIVEAAKIIQESNDPDNKKIRFHILGNGKDLNNVKMAAKGIDNITFYGRKPIEDMPKYYTMADAMLVTLDSFLDITLPGKIQSYMAAGKPIIGAIDGETKNIINASGCGFVSKSGDSEALADNIIRFCKLSSDEKKQLGLRSKNFYNEHFNRKKHIDSIEKYLSE